ncbi:CrcB family protein [Natronomonas sp. LN261]|uniref:fluoride efflux transporter FluC n=1 Tax=Natronomonas sp. LN261 TaxID=2750669 RepID=UPI0015EEAAD4
MALVGVAAVGLGGALGAVSRYAVGRTIERRGGDIAFVNVVGSFLLGVIVGLDPGGPAALALGVGFCGAFTTFSSFAVGTVRLVEDGAPRAAAINAVGTLAAALAAAVLGGAVAGML